ncbi:MAG: hypothetical protein AAFR17_19060, partial [Pseudomonadota bacterium]
MAAHAERVDRAFQDWLAAQNALITAERPAWDTIRETNRAATRLGHSIGGVVPPPPLPFPFRDLPSRPQPKEPAHQRFLNADLMLKTRLAPAWLDAADALVQADPRHPPAALRAWGKALDEAFYEVTGAPGFAAVQAEWVRAALGCGFSLIPPDIPLPGKLPPIARTPKSEIWRNGPASLARYRAGSGTPLIIVHGLINRQTVIDLIPGDSLV